MREVKFKAKIQGTDAWIIGLPHSVYGDCIDSIQTLDGETEYIRTDTLCQFTGLTDKNGVDIYEGDKLTVSIEFLFSPEKNHFEDAVVVWLNFRSSFAVSFSCDGSEFPNNDLYKYVQNVKHKPVLTGNIHD